MNRAEQIRGLNRLSVEQLARRAGNRLLICDSLDELHQHMAEAMAADIRRSMAQGPLALIVPYGPTGQYPILKEIIQRERLSLKHLTLFFMDEYCDANGRVIPADHPCSFRGGIQWFFDALDPACRPERVIFPDEQNLAQLDDMIERAGGIDTLYGGIGIHGHVAFNEPEPGVRDMGNRIVTLNDFTVTMNAIRSHVGGDLENFPRQAVTLGMKQCLSARRIRLYCRNDIPGIDWANTVLRLAVLGEPGDDYPVTWIRQHSDWQIVTDRNTAATPQHTLSRHAHK